MLHAIFQGFLWGLLLSALIGPIFFLLIRTSIERGVKDAVLLDVGVVLSDALVILLAYKGLATVFQNIRNQQMLGYCGGTLLILFGLIPLFKKPKPAKEIEIKIQPNYFLLSIKGVALNLSNPFVWLYWIACVGVAVTEFSNSTSLVFIYFITCIITFFSLDVLKIYLASKIKLYLTPKRLKLINAFANIGIIGFGVIMIIRVLGLR